MGKLFHSTLYWACAYLSVMGLKLIHVRKIGLDCMDVSTQRSSRGLGIRKVIQCIYFVYNEMLWTWQRVEFYLICSVYHIDVICTCKEDPVVLDSSLVVYWHDDKHSKPMFLSQAENVLMSFWWFPKWPAFCRRRFQMHFNEWKWLHFDETKSLDFVLKAPIDNKSALVLITVCRRP